MRKPRFMHPPTVLFWRQVEKTNGCWLWTGRDVTPNGYGRFAYREANGQPQKRKMAHRWAYEEALGPIPDGLTIDHLCKTTLCVRPDHLEVVTLAENLRRSSNVTTLNTHKTHCPQGHPYDELNTYLNPSGERICRKCHQASHRARYRAKRSAEGREVGAYVGDRTHCPQGHEYTPENTRSHKGKRHCRTCLRANQRAYYQRTKHEQSPQ